MLEKLIKILYHINKFIVNFKGKIIMKKLYIGIFTIVFMMVFPQIYINASTGIPAVVIPDISESLITSQLDFRIDNFNSESISGWQANQNVQSLSVTQSIAPYPFSPFEGNGCLSVQSSPAILNGWRRVTKTYNIPYNLSESNVFFIAVNLPDLADTYDVMLIMDGYTSTATGCKPGTWNGIFFDISNYDNKSEITSFTIAVRYNSEINYNSEYVYYIDMVGGFRNLNIVNAIKYLSSDYYTSGGTLLTGENYMTLEVIDENPYIETYSFNPEILNDSKINSIKIKLKNNSDCQAISFFYTTSRNPSFSQERSYIIAAENNGDTQTCYFPLSSGSIDQIRILFNGATTGDIEIYSITPSSSYIPLASGYGTVDECTIGANKRAINISGTLTEDAYNDFRGMYLELYTLDINEPPENIFNRNLNPIAQVRVDRSFVFSVPLDDNKTLISSKFIVIVNTGSEKIFIDMPKYITNPEILAANKYTNPKSNIKKGMNSPVTEAQILGVKHTYLTININNLITLDETAYQHVVDGYTYYFSNDYINSLDNTLIKYQKANIGVTVILNLKSSSDDTLNEILIHPDADYNRIVNGYAFNTSNPDGVRYLRAVFDFFARRYSSDDVTNGRIANYVIGNKVGLAYLNYNMGEKTLFEFVEIYASAVRLAYNTIKSISSAPNIYISLDYTWDEDLPASNLLRYDNRVLLDTLSAYIKSRGDINWNLVFDPYPHNRSDVYTPWNDDNAADSFDSSIITARNIEALCRYMARPQLSYTINATPRSIIIIEQSALPAGSSEPDINNYTAGYIYTFYKINMRACSLIESYIINRNNEDEFKNLIKYIDTDMSFNVTDSAKTIIGVSDWSDAINNYDTSLIVRRNVIENQWTDVLPNNIIGTAELWKFDNTADSDGWQTAEYCESVTSGSQFFDRSSLLKAQLNKASLFNEYRGIENILPFATDLSHAPYLSFDVQISMLPTNVTDVELLLFVQAGDNYILSSGKIITGNVNQIVLDMTEFVGVKSIDHIKIWLRGIDGQIDIGEPVIFISDVIIHSLEYTTEYIINNLQEQRELHLTSYNRPIDMRIVWILIVVIIIATTLLVINILNRRKVIEREDDWYDDKRY